MIRNPKALIVTSCLIAMLVLSSCSTVQPNEVSSSEAESSVASIDFESEIAAKDKEIALLKEQLEAAKQEAEKAQSSSEAASVPEKLPEESSKAPQSSSIAPPPNSSAAATSLQATSSAPSSSAPLSSTASSKPATSSVAASKPASSAVASSSQAPSKPQVEINGNSATVKIDFGGGGDSSKPTLEHSEIIALCREVAEEMGLEWAGKPLEGFDFGVTIEGRTKKELRAYLETTYKNYLEIGVVYVYATIDKSYEFYDLTIYRG